MVASGKKWPNILADRWKGWTKEKRFLLGAGIAWVSAICYVLSLVGMENLSFRESVRWLQHNPGLTLFELTFKAMAFGTFASMFPDTAFVTGYEKIKSWAILLLVILTAMSTVVVFTDVYQGYQKRVVSPIMFKSPQRDDLNSLDVSLREQIRSATTTQATGDQAEVKKRYEQIIAGGGDEIAIECKPKITESNQDVNFEAIKTAQDCYKAAERSVAKKTFFNEDTASVKLLSFLSGSSCTAILTVFMTLTSAWFIAVTFWYLLVMAFSRTSLLPASFEALLLTYAFIVPWFPLRMYSEWYVSYGTLDLRQYQAFFLSAILAFVFLGFLLLLKSPNALLNAIVGGLSGFTAIAGVIAKFDPKMFNSIAWQLVEMDEWGFGFAGIVVILLLVLLACISYYSKEPG